MRHQLASVRLCSGGPGDNGLLHGSIRSEGKLGEVPKNRDSPSCSLHVGFGSGRRPREGLAFLATPRPGLCWWTLLGLGAQHPDLPSWGPKDQSGQ